MKRQEFDSYIQDADFSSLFNQMGWNNPDQAAPVIVGVEEERYKLVCVAQRNGFKVYTCEVAAIPLMAVVKTIDKRLRKSSNDYILIFVETPKQVRGDSPVNESRHAELDSASLHHEWIVPVKSIEKRVLVPVEYATASQLDFLYSKHTELSFDIEEETTILDVTKRVHAAFELNSEKVTKDFYAGFKKQHNSFADFISGIPVESDRQWYVSVMLNRLMFCYFIQKKGFLDFNPNYLRDKLNECKVKHGKDKFFKSFYKSFLLQLFQGGLNSPDHDSAEFKATFGRIPYLNGGMFDQHQIEKQYADIDIADEAFENLFAFFDKYHWHLDTRIEASGKDINPDVLGYIFEQYINDRAQMGAYYTKEDITNYIGKNCILPFLWEDTLRRHAGIEGSHAELVSAPKQPPKQVRGDGTTDAQHDIWAFLQQSGDRYIYESVKHGVSLPLPKNIAVGLNAEQPNLLYLRKDWNTPAPAEYGLPTEIWRETVARRTRYEELKRKIEGGEITRINDFITYNLDITGFVQDFLSETDDLEFVRAFYESLCSVSILDPTCGSGAFLFAALNILEPLYEICIDRLEGVQAEIKDKYRSNIQYFIYKNIILRNLYGVDIMAEATEIAKLRLFLKMVAVVEADRKLENLGLDPLPDIDFNIRSGNTLVGYATKDEILNGFTDLFERAEWESKIQRQVEEVCASYKVFKDWQLKAADSAEDFKTAKRNLGKELSELNEMLNKWLFGKSRADTYEKWLSDCQPFHWFAEFYEIVAERGGFDVIIGNPPYVTINSTNVSYQIPENYKSKDSGDLFAVCVERFTKISKSNIGVIIPLSLTATEKMKDARKEIYNCFSISWNSYYSASAQPSCLFDGVRHRLMILLGKIEKNSNDHSYFVTNFKKWLQNERAVLFELVNYQNSTELKNPLCKISEINGLNILKKLQNEQSLNSYVNGSSQNVIYYHNAPVYWGKVFDFVPLFQKGKNLPEQSSHVKNLTVSKKEYRYSIIDFLNSSFFYWYNWQYTNCRDLSKSNIENAPLNLEKIYTNLGNELDNVCKELMNDYKKNSTLYTRVSKGETTVFDSFYPAKSKPIIDKIDTLLAKHYGFTQEELDFIINYDIKYRMGAELDGE